MSAAPNLSLSARASPRNGRGVAGRYLALQAMWTVTALVALGVFVAALPSRYHELSHGFSGSGASIGSFTLSHAQFALTVLAIEGLFVAVWSAVGWIIFLRRRDDPVALLVGLMLVTWGPMNGLVVLAPSALTSTAGQALTNALSFVAYMAWMLFFYLFPSGRFVPTWTRAFAAAWLFFVFSWVATPFGPPAWPPPIFGLAIFILWGSFAVSQVYCYLKVSSFGERQQTKWVVFGIATAVVGFLGTTAIVGAPADLTHAGMGRQLLSTVLTCGFMALIPIAIGIAILKRRLFDIDLLINRALVYGSVTGSLAVLYVGGVVGLQSLFRLTSGQNSDLAIAISTLGIAALFQPLRHRMQAFIDRRFYRRKYDAARTLASFQARLVDEVDTDQLSADLLGIVRETVQPTEVWLWLADRR